MYYRNSYSNPSFSVELFNIDSCNHIDFTKGRNARLFSIKIAVNSDLYKEVQSHFICSLFDSI